MSDLQPPIWLTGYLRQSLIEMAELGHRYNANTIVDICDISNSRGRKYSGAPADPLNPSRDGRDY